MTKVKGTIALGAMLAALTVVGINSQADGVMTLFGNDYNIQVHSSTSIADAYLLYGSFTSTDDSIFSGGISLINGGLSLINNTNYSVNVGSATPAYYGLMGVYSGDTQGVTLGMSTSTAANVASGESFGTFLPRELSYFQFPNQVTNNHATIDGQSASVTFNINPIDSSNFSENTMVSDLQALATGVGTVTGISGTYSYTFNGTLFTGTFPNELLSGVPVHNPVAGFTFSISTTSTIISNIQSDLISTDDSGTLVDFTNGSSAGSFSVTPTPEPSSMWLLGSAGLPLLAWRKRRMA